MIRLCRNQGGHAPHIRGRGGETTREPEVILRVCACDWNHLHSDREMKDEGIQMHCAARKFIWAQCQAVLNHCDEIMRGCRGPDVQHLFKPVGRQRSLSDEMCISFCHACMLGRKIVQRAAWVILTQAVFVDKRNSGALTALLPDSLYPAANCFQLPEYSAQLYHLPQVS